MTEGWVVQRSRRRTRRSRGVFGARQRAAGGARRPWVGGCRAAWLVLAAVVVAVGAGCRVGPNYRRPEVAVPSDWRWKSAEPRDHVTKGAWWSLFADLELDRLQALAAAQNQELKAAMARVEQARAAARMSRADLFPTLQGAAVFNRFRTSANSPSPVPQFEIPSFHQQSWQTPLDLSFELDLWGKVRRGFESARAQAWAAESARQWVQLTLQAEVATQYFLGRRAAREAEILRRTIEIREEALELIRQRVSAGLSSQFEWERGRVEVEGAKANLAGVEQRRAEAENALAVLCGVPPSGFETASGPEPVAVPEVGVALPSTLLERRPDVAQAERELASRNARIGVARAAYFPSVRLTAAGGLLSGELEDLFRWESRTWSIGPSVSLPLFAGGRNRAEVERARAAYEEGVALYRERVLVAFREVEDSLVALRFLRVQGEARDAAATAAAAAARLAYDRYRAGAVNFLEIVDAEQARLLNETGRVVVESERLLATVRLIKALGGGWETGSESTTVERARDHEAQSE